VNVSNIDAGKAQVQVADTLPPDVVQSIAGSLADAISPAAAASSLSQRRGSSAAFRSPVETEVGEYIWGRMRALGRSGGQFEDAVEYVNDDREAEDARDIVQGIDPALRGSAGGGFFSARRSIPVERRHWIACWQGHYMKNSTE
jgi:hypothetical protein